MNPIGYAVLRTGLDIDGWIYRCGLKSDNIPSYINVYEPIGPFERHSVPLLYTPWPQKEFQHDFIGIADEIRNGRERVVTHTQVGENNEMKQDGLVGRKTHETPLTLFMSTQIFFFIGFYFQFFYYFIILFF